MSSRHALMLFAIFGFGVMAMVMLWIGWQGLKQGAPLMPGFPILAVLFSGCLMVVWIAVQEWRE